MYEPSIKKRKLLEKITLHIKSDQDDDDVESTNQGNIEYIKQDLKEVIDYNNTTIYHSDGSIVITPHYFENLPNEILDNILDCLSAIFGDDLEPLQDNHYQLCLVNKQFYHRVNRLLWHTPYIVNRNEVERFITCLTNAQIIQQSTTPSDGCSNARHYPVPHNILTAKHHVRRLDTRRADWDNIQLSVTMPYLGLLESLDIMDPYGISKITHAILPRLPSYCPHLTRLALSNDMISQPNCLDAILHHCHQLRHLEFFIHYNTYSQQYLIFETLLDCPSLTTLLLHSGKEYGRTSHLDETMMMNITQLHQLTTMAFLGNNMTETMDLFLKTVDMTTIWPHLTFFSMDGAELLTDAIMIPFIESHPHIQYLDLTSTRFSNATLNKIAIHLPRLTHLRMVDNRIITPDGVYHLIRHCHDLQKADFSLCTHLVDSMIKFSELQMWEPASLTGEQMEKIRQRDIN